MQQLRCFADRAGVRYLVEVSVFGWKKAARHFGIIKRNGLYLMRYGGLHGGRAITSGSVSISYPSFAFMT